MHYLGHLDRHALGTWIAIGMGVFVAIAGAFVAAFYREKDPDA